ncbi:unnamed protein product, partial [Closterium sp. NIES-54]
MLGFPTFAHLASFPPVQLPTVLDESCHPPCFRSAIARLYVASVLWHHCFGHLCLLRLRSMVSQRLVSSLLHVFESLPPSHALRRTPCVKGGLRTTAHSSSLCPATAPFQTLHLDDEGPAPCPRLKRESYFLVVVDDSSHYTMVFPLAKKSNVSSTLIRWLLATEATCGSRVVCLHSDHGDEFRYGILRGFSNEWGITQSWTLAKSPQQSRVADCRIGLVMEITHTSMIHARAPHFFRGPTRRRHYGGVGVGGTGAGAASPGGAGAGGAGSGGVGARGAGSVVTGTRGTASA